MTNMRRVEALERIADALEGMDGKIEQMINGNGAVLKELQAIGLQLIALDTSIGSVETAVTKSGL
jgi:hypothetical protein